MKAKLNSLRFLAQRNACNLRYAAVSVMLLGAAAANAEPIDVAATVTYILAQLAPIALVGAAVLSVRVSIKAFKWVRAAL